MILIAFISVFFSFSIIAIFFYLASVYLHKSFFFPIISLRFIKASTRYQSESKKIPEEFWINDKRIMLLEQEPDVSAIIWTTPKKIRLIVGDTVHIIPYGNSFCSLYPSRKRTFMHTHICEIFACIRE